MDYTQQPHSELLTELKENLYEQPATVGQRFLNYLIDVFFFYVIIIALSAIAGLLIGFGYIEGNAVFGISVLLEYLLIYTVLIAMYTFFETVAKGRTIGKMVTKTRAVKSDGSALTFNDALKRSLIRIIPFEPLTAFGGNPWHDKWTETKVIKDVN
jgi:uncharacterized RDD family membrane protein YckC